MNSVFFSRLINTIFFISGCWFLPEKFSFCPKNNGFARVWGLQPPGSYAYVTPMAWYHPHYAKGLSAFARDGYFMFLLATDRLSEFGGTTACTIN